MLPLVLASLDAPSGCSSLPWQCHSFAEVISCKRIATVGSFATVESNKTRMILIYSYVKNKYSVVRLAIFLCKKILLEYVVVIITWAQMASFGQDEDTKWHRLAKMRTQNGIVWSRWGHKMASFGQDEDTKWPPRIVVLIWWNEDMMRNKRWRPN